MPYHSASGGGTVVAARYKTAAGQSIASGTPAIVDFGSQDYDTSSAVTTGASWQYAVPATGKYRISARVTFAQSTAWLETEYGQLSIYKGGAQLVSLGIVGAQDASSNFKAIGDSTTLSLTAGDLIDIRVHQNSGAAIALHNDAAYNHVSIEKVG